MNELTIGTMMESYLWLALIVCPALVVYTLVKKKLTKTRFLRFLGILSIGAASSLIPLGPLSMTVGAPAVLISSILVSLLLDKE